MINCGQKIEKVRTEELSVAESERKRCESYEEKRTQGREWHPSAP